MEGGDRAPPPDGVWPEPPGADRALSSLDTIDAQIHHKIGLLESLLGSCDGVLRRHDAADAALPPGAPWKAVDSGVAHRAAADAEEEVLAQRSHPGNPASAVPPWAAAERAQRAHGEPPAHDRSHAEAHDRPTRPQEQGVARPVARMVEAARLLRAQRVLCKVARQLCGARHAHCCLSSLRIHRLAEHQMRHAVAAEFGRFGSPSPGVDRSGLRRRRLSLTRSTAPRDRSEVVRGLRLVSWEDSAVAQAFLGWHLIVVRRRDGVHERQRILLIANVESQCLAAHVLQMWRRVAQETLAACGKVQRLLSFLTMRMGFLRWVRLAALARRTANTMRYQQARLWDIKCRCFLNAWKRMVREREVHFARGACNGAILALSTFRVRGIVSEVFLSWRSLRACTRSVAQCARRQSKAATCLYHFRVCAKLRSVIGNWRYRQHYKLRLQLGSMDVKMRRHLRLRRVAFHCWYAVRQEHKASAQKWWWENKLETLMKTIEAHEEACSQQERTVQAYLDTSCRLEDRVADLRLNIDMLRSSRANVRIRCSGLIRMLSFAAWRLYDSLRWKRLQNTHGSDAVSPVMGALEPAHVSNNTRYGSSGMAMIAVSFSVWLCALASSQVLRLRAADLSRKFSVFHLQRVVGCWLSRVKRAQRRVKIEGVISRRVNLSLSRRFMRCWSGTYFTYSTFLKIRKCRAKNLYRRIVHAQLVVHWSRWAHFSSCTRHLGLVLQRSGHKNRRQLVFKFLGSWYLFSKLQQQRQPGDSVLLDASHGLAFAASGQDEAIGDGAARSLTTGIFEHAATVHLLTDKEMELRDLRNQLYMRDENFAHLRAALADSESQIAAIQDNLSSEMALSELDQSAALERVECLAMEKEQAEDTMKDLKASVVLLTEASEALKNDLDTARDQASEARRELKTCRKDLQEAHKALEKKNELIDTLTDVSTGAISVDVLQDEAHAEVRDILVKHQSEARVAQLNMELEQVKAQLQARDVTERELRAALAQRLEGDAVMELREERNVLRSELETVRRDLQASTRELEICKGLAAEPRTSAKMTLEPQKDQELLLLEQKVLDLKVHLKEQTAEFETRAQAAEEMCQAYLSLVERMQIDVKCWQNKAEEHLAAKEEAEAKAADEISRAEERLNQIISQSEVERQAQDTAAQEMLQDAEGARDEAMRSAEAARDEIRQASILRDQAIEREKSAEYELQQARQAHEKAARNLEKTREELQQALDRECAKDEVIRTQKTSSDALESNLQEVKSIAAKEAATKDDTIHKQMATVSALELQLKEVQASAAKESAVQYSRLTAVSDSLEKLRRQNAQLEEELDTARLTAARASTEGALLQSSITDLSESRRQRENELLDKDEELRKLRREVAGHTALSNAMEKLRRQNVQLDDELTAMRLKAADASTEGRLLNSSLCSSTSAKQRLEHELANKSEELLKLQLQISGLSSEHETTQAKLAVSERLCQEQEGRIRALTAELQLMRAQRIAEAQHAMPRRQESLPEFGTRHEDQVPTYTSQIESLKARIVSVEEDARRARHDRDQAVLGEERARDDLQKLLDTRKQEQALVKDRESGIEMLVPRTECEVERMRSLTSEVESLKAELAKAKDDALHSQYALDSPLQKYSTMNAEHKVSALDATRDQALATQAVPEQAQQSEQNKYDKRVQTLSTEIQGLRKQLADAEGDAQDARSALEHASQGEERALAELDALKKHLEDVMDDAQKAWSERNQAAQGEERALAELEKLSKVLQPKEDGCTQKDDIAPAGSAGGRSPEQGMRSKPHDHGRAPTPQMLDEEAGSINARIATLNAKQKPVDIVMKLGLNFSAAGEEGSKARRLFERSLVQDLANASGMPATNFKVRNMSPGSVMVDIRVLPNPSRGFDPEHVVKDLEAQADDAGSQLMNGILTRYTQSLALSARPGSDSDFLSEQDFASPRGTYSEASQSLGVTSSSELVNYDAEHNSQHERTAQEKAAQNAQHFVLTRQNELLVLEKKNLEKRLKVAERELAEKLEQLKKLQEQVVQHAKDTHQMSQAAQLDASAQAHELNRLQSEILDQEARRQNLEDKVKVTEQVCQEKEQRIRELQAELESVRTNTSSCAGQKNEIASVGSGAVAGMMLLDPDESLALLEQDRSLRKAGNGEAKEPVLQFSKRRGHPAVNISPVEPTLARQDHVASEDSEEDLATFKDHERHVTALQAKLDECATALSEKQTTIDTLVRERDMISEEASNLRASLQDTTLALNATKRRLENVVLESSAADLSGEHSECEVAQKLKDSVEMGMQASLERKAAYSKSVMARDMQREEWSRMLNNLRVQLEAAEAKAAAASARAASVTEIHKMHRSKSSLQCKVLQAQKEEANGRAHAAENMVEMLHVQIANLEREHVETRRQLGDALLQNTAMDAMQSYEHMLSDLQSTRVQRDSWQTNAEAWEASARAEKERCKEQETSMQAVASVAHSLEQSCKEWELMVQELQAQRDEAMARAAASESRACKLEVTFASSAAFLEDLSHQMERVRGNDRHFWTESAIGTTKGGLGSGQFVSSYAAHSQDLERAWNEWRSHAETIRAQTEQKPESAVLSAQDTCEAYLKALQVWDSKVQVLEEACLHWHGRAESLKLGREAAMSASECEQQGDLVRGSVAEVKSGHQAFLLALVERVYQLEKLCVEWQWNVEFLESQAQEEPSPSHMPGLSADEMPDLRTLHHLQCRLDSLESAFELSKETCEELQMKLDTLCSSCIEQTGGLGGASSNTAYEKALHAIVQYQTWHTSGNSLPEVAGMQPFADDAWRVVQGDEAVNTSNKHQENLCSTLEAIKGLEALKHDLLDLQAVFTESVGEILISEEDMHGQILFLQKVSLLSYLCSPTSLLLIVTSPCPLLFCSLWSINPRYALGPGARRTDLCFHVYLCVSKDYHALS